MNQQSKLMQQIHFLVEIDKLKNVFRQSRLIDTNRKENDAEHSWHIAMMATILSEYAPRDLDHLRVIRMLLIHDLVEIEAGDVFVYDITARQAQKTVEKEAAEKIFGLLPEKQYKDLLALWDEFEDRQTPEAKFARALDRLQPLILNYFSEGQTWLEHQTEKEKVLEINKIIADASSELWDFAQALILESNRKGYLS